MDAEIPPDIAYTAAYVVGEWYDDQDELRRAIAQAIFAERKRCARIAEAVDLKPATGWSEREASWWETGQNDASLAIAAHIRS